MRPGMRIQRHRIAGWRRPAGAVIIDRTSNWGNPFTTETIQAAGDAQTQREARVIAVRRYGAWLDGDGPDTYAVTTRRSVSRTWILAHLEQLAGKALVCTCPVDEFPCHGDELARRATERAVYAERAQIVALLTRWFRGALSHDQSEPLCPDVVYFETPAGQLSWHLAAVDVERFFGHVDHVPTGHERARWDRHTTAEKYNRIRQLTTGSRLPAP